MRVWRALIVAVLSGIATMAPARADTVYAYWSYWQGDSGAWKYATTGPATANAVDGAVDGWRFTLGSVGRAAHPAPAADFESVCGSTARQSGSVRVAIIIDYGAAATAAPAAQCAVIAAGLSRASALSAVAELRFNNGFICGINNIPERGCGEAVTAPSPSATATAWTTAPARTSPAATPSPTPTETPRTTPSAATSPASTGTPSVAVTPAPVRSGSAPAAVSETSLGAQPGSPLATVVTMVLAGIVLALALRNAKRQRAAR